MMKAMVLALGLAAVLAAVIGLSLAAAPGGVQAQGGIAAPGNVRAVDGSATGEVVVSWNAVAGASFYRVGWVLMSDIDAVQADGRNWLDAFDFKDVENKGQTTQTLRGLLPGVQYAFIVGSVSQRFGVASGWSEWTYLTTVADAAFCPMDTGGAIAYAGTYAYARAYQHSSAAHTRAHQHSGADGYARPDANSSGGRGGRRRL